jgi:TATA-box binding protein (TBP) (component of TFIID and TFIIIB)
MSFTYNDIIEELKERISYNERQKDFDSIPEDLEISTITICCSFDNEFDIENITKWLKIDNNIEAVGKRDNNIKNVNNNHKKRGRRSLKVKKYKQNKGREHFFNQISLKVIVPNKANKRPVNIKLFKNGSVQMTGCSTLMDSLDAICTCMIALNTVRGVIIDNKIVDKKFCKVKLKASNLNDFKICLINSGFTLPFWINRGKLLEIMLADDINTFYDRNIHSGVIIKYKVIDTNITILVFEQGSVVITGARISQHMKEAYNFINTKLLENYIEIYKEQEVEYLY